MDPVPNQPRWADISPQHLLEYYMDYQPPHPGYYPPLITQPPPPSIICPPPVDGLPNFLRFENYQQRSHRHRLYIAGPPNHSLAAQDSDSPFDLNRLYQFSASEITDVVMARRQPDPERSSLHTVFIVVWTEV